MKKILLVISLFVLIPGLIWAQEYTIKPGVSITKDNYEKYIPELKRLLPRGTFPLQINGLKNGWITMPIVKEESRPLNTPYVEASRKNDGKFKVGSRNRLIQLRKERWTSGAPFPYPKTAAELAWNCYRRCGGADDYGFPANYLFYSKDCKLEREFTWYCRGKRWIGRWAFPPIPEYPGNNGVINLKESILILKPYDVRGFSLIRIRYEDLEKDDDSYSYIPAIRRIRRLTGSDLTDPLLGSDAIPDDFQMWRQKLSPLMTFKMREDKKLLDVLQFGKKPKGEFVRNTLQSKWEIRPVWVLIVFPNDPNYAYSKRIIYVDKHGGYRLAYGENYDQKGRFYRCGHMMHSPHLFFKGSWCEDVAYGYVYQSILSGHSTVGDHYPIWNDPKCTVESFTIRQLLKDAR